MVSAPQPPPLSSSAHTAVDIIDDLDGCNGDAAECCVSSASDTN